MVVCALFPRFELIVAAGGRSGLVDGPVALAPAPGGDPCVGEVSATAETYGVLRGMRLGEALGRCPGLRLIVPDPIKVTMVWERILEALEGIGAGVEAGAIGILWFDAQRIRRLYGGCVEGVIAKTRRVLTMPARIGVAPSRFGALAAASKARSRRAVIAPAKKKGFMAFLAPLSVDLLARREETMHLPETLQRFGIRTLGELAAVSRDALFVRFGEAGALAYDLARGRDRPLRPRQPSELLEETLELYESTCGEQLQRALGLLIDRLLANKKRRGRSFRAVVISAVFVEGGTWQRRITFRQALVDSRRMNLALSGKLGELPAPVKELRLCAEGLGFARPEQGVLLVEGEKREANLREGIRQARTAAGVGAALRVATMDYESRLPERQFALTPWLE